MVFMVFWAGKTEKNEDFEQRLQKLESEMRKTRAEVIDVAATIEILRNKVLKKIKLKPEDVEEQPKDLYNGMLLKDV